jgi:hypothetical protein
MRFHGIGRCGVWLQALVLVVCAISVADAQPRVILRIENATLAEALRTLERHTGTRFWLDSMPLNMRFGIGGVANDPTVALLFAFTHLSDPSLTVPFRLENIPLPEMAALDTGEK